MLRLLLLELKRQTDGESTTRRPGQNRERSARGARKETETRTPARRPPPCTLSSCTTDSPHPASRSRAATRSTPPLRSQMRRTFSSHRGKASAREGTARKEKKAGDARKLRRCVVDCRRLVGRVTSCGGVNEEGGAAFVLELRGFFGSAGGDQGGRRKMAARRRKDGGRWRREEWRKESAGGEEGRPPER